MAKASASTSPSSSIALLGAFRAGAISRRRFIRMATAGGMSVAAASFLANGGNPLAAQSTPAATPGATPGASPAASPTAQRPAVGTEGLARGASGELRILWWQAPTVLNPHLGGDTGSGFIIEPLLNYFPDASIQPILLQETPSVENGQLAEDFSAVTLRLKEGLVWSDGEPVTANDIVFTWQWVINEANPTTSKSQWGTIKSIEAVDDLTANVTFNAPIVNWFDAFTGELIGSLLPAHAFNNDPANTNDQFQTSPIGTGPYVVESFTPNDQGTYVINERYRDPDKPYFSRILVKGGGDAVAAGRAVMQTGEFDFAWNIQAEPTVIEQLRQGGYGEILTTTGTTLEALYFNFSDPNKEVDGQRSEMNTPHPILSDPAVRDAISLAINRELIAEKFYGDKKFVTPNMLTGLDFFESPNTSWSFDPDAARKVLDDAGWTQNGDVRAKDGVELKLNLVASVNPVRQQTQAVMKANLEDIGFSIDIPQVDSTIFFDTTAGNDQNLEHFYFDMGIWSSGSDTKIPVTWMSRWYAGPDGEGIAQESNGWQRDNAQRYKNEEYDQLFDALRQSGSDEEAAKNLIAMNDILINDDVVVPLVLRPFFTAVSNRLQKENLDFDSAFTGYFWNLINWTLAEGNQPR